MTRLWLDMYRDSMKPCVVLYSGKGLGYPLLWLYSDGRVYVDPHGRNVDGVFIK